MVVGCQSVPEGRHRPDSEGNLVWKGTSSSDKGVKISSGGNLSDIGLGLDRVECDTVLILQMYPITTS